MLLLLAPQLLMLEAVAEEEMNLVQEAQAEAEVVDVGHK